MGRQNNCALLVTLGDFLYDRPHEATRFRVHTCRGLIEQDDGGIAHDGHSYRKLALVAAGERAGGLVPVLCQVQLLDCILNDVLATVNWDTLDLRVEPKVLLDRHQFEDSVVLRAVPDHLASLLKFRQDIEATDGDISARWQNIPR